MKSFNVKSRNANLNYSLTNIYELHLNKAYDQHIYHVSCKLMQLDRPWAKFRSKSYLNCLLIDFFDPNLAVRSIVATISIQLRSTIGQNRLILIDNWSIYIDKVFFYINCRFWYKLSFSINKSTFGRFISIKRSILYLKRSI